MQNFGVDTVFERVFQWINELEWMWAFFIFVEENFLSEKLRLLSKLHGPM